MWRNSTFISSSRLFNEFFDEMFSDLSAKAMNKSIFIPYVDVIENDKEFEVQLMLAGFNKDDVKVSVEKNALTIKGERKQDTTLKYNTQRSFFGTFEKGYELPEYVDKSNINASFENGVLKITIPKSESKDSESKVIEIK